MSGSYELIDQNGRLAVALQTDWLKATLIPAVHVSASDATAKRTLVNEVAYWQGRGYVLEDACVLALFAFASQQMHGVHTLESASPHPDAYPQLIDATSGPRSSTAFPPMTNPSPGIYPIVDDLKQLTLMLKAGAKILQLRIKSESLNAEIRGQIRQAVQMSRDYPDCQLFVNDYWQAAIEEGAWGVHLGQEDLLAADLLAIAQAGLRLGVSSHAYWEVARAMCVKPSYIACGPLFPTRVKAMPWIPQGIDNLRYWVALLPFPVVGIGGVNAENLPQIRATGCGSASVIQAIMAAPDPTAAYQTLQAQWESLACNQTSSASIPLARPTLAATADTGPKIPQSFIQASQT